MATGKIFVAGVVAVLFAFGCGQKDKEGHDEHHGHDDSESNVEWKEMDDYHAIMADAFHPYKDSANLAPAKRLAGELATAAEKWKESDRPEKVDNDEVKDKLDELVDQSRKFEEVVKSGNDDDIAKSLNSLHDHFHDLQNEWYSAGAGDDHHDHHDH